MELDLNIYNVFELLKNIKDIESYNVNSDVR